MASSARIDELKKKFDENPRRYFAPLANEYRKSGDLEKAIFICQEYLPQQPGHMSGHIVYGQALYELSRFDESRAVFETALSLDPENLIALRHLGDIARQSGDSRDARVWYQRVLEADPRNEEIAQIMMTLLTTPEQGVPAVSSAPSDQGTPTLIMEPIRAPTPGLSTIAVEKSLDRTGIDLGPELASLPERQVPSEEPPPLPPPAPVSTWGEAPPPSADDDLLDLNDFTVGGVSLSSLGAPPPAIEPLSSPPAASSSMEEETAEFETASIAEASVSSETSDDAGFDLGHEDGPFEADPFAIAAKPESPAADVPNDAPIELATDIELGLPSDGQQTTTFSESQGERLANLESFGETVIGADAAAPPSTLEVETFFAGMSSEPLVEMPPELPPIESHRVETPAAPIEVIESHREETPVTPFEPLESHRPETPSASFAGIETPGFVDVIAPVIPPVTPAPAAPEMPELPEMAEIPETPAPVDAGPPAPTWTSPEPMSAVPEAAPSEEFVTETMAELYLEQGHPESAVGIYQRLAAQRPDDVQLADRLRAVEAMLSDEQASEPHAATEPASAIGPTIREFLAGLLRHWGSAPAAPAAEPQADAFSSMETPITTPRVPAPALDMTAVAPPRTPTPVYDFDAIETTVSYEEETYVVETPTHASIDEDFGAPVEEPIVESVDAMELEPEAPAAPLAATPAPTPVATPVATPVVPTAPTPPRPTFVRGTPGSSATVSGSIDALFLGAGASAADSHAAATLSQAFAAETPEPPPAPPPLQGVPAHAASSELSLDHVFKTTQGRRQDAENDGFSFDQFFADELGDNASKGGAEPPSTPAKSAGPGDDIAQFNNWLNGLKKT